MKLVDYSKNKHKKMSLRATIWSAVIWTLLCGFFLGTALIEATQGREAWGWTLSLALAFSNGVQALQCILLALHDCPPSTKTSQSNDEAAVSSIG